MTYPPPYNLSGGTVLPAVGFGTFQSDSGNAGVKRAVAAALEAGYRHIDTATAYGNEQEVGQAIQESGLPRDEVFVTTKLHQTWHRPGDVAEALDQSLRALQLHYVDLYLMHFPHAYIPGPNHSTVRHPGKGSKPMLDYDLSRAYPAVWKAMEALVDTGKARAIGISNFNILKTKRILKVARIRPAVNQVELHPYLPQKQLVDFCRLEGIHVMAHQPLGGKPVGVVAPNAHIPGPMKDRKVAEIAARTGRSPAQVLLSWAVQRGTSVIPKACTPEHIGQNLRLFQLSDRDFRVVDNLKTPETSIRYMDPRNHIGFDLFDESADEPLMSQAPWDSRV